MTSSEGDRAADRGSFDALHVAADRFEAIFQVLKEAPNLPDQVLGPLEGGTVDVASAVRVAREIERRLENAAFVKLMIFYPEREAEMNEFWFPSNVGQPEEPGEVEAFVNRDLVDSWRDLAAAVLTSFSERELSLRTGYTIGELERACRPLINSRTRQSP